MEFVIAPDKFKGTLRAAEVAEAMARGVRTVFPTASQVLRPMADGGEGTIDALLTALGGRETFHKVRGPLGDEVEAGIGWLSDGRAVIEVAQAAGLVLLEPEHLAPLEADTHGVGELIRIVVESGRARSVVIGIGGSATTDGGTGAARALGWRFLDRDGNELPPGGGSLVDLARIDDSSVATGLHDLEVVVASDVDNPLLGERGTAHVFAPQKGANEEQVELLERAMDVLAKRIAKDLGIEVAELPGAGAAGGLGAGLIAFCGARVLPGFDLIADAAELTKAVRAADYVLTGEGRLDAQSVGGKTPIGVARLAAKAFVPCYAIAGDIPMNERKALRDQGFAGMASVVEAVGSERAFEQPAEAVAKATENLLRARVLREVPGSRRRRII